MTVNQKIQKLVEAWEFRFAGRSTVMHRASDYNLRRGCVNKIRYETWGDAKQAVRSLYIYRCEFCNGYHHTREWPGRGPK